MRIRNRSDRTAKTREAIGPLGAIASERTRVIKSYGESCVLKSKLGGRAWEEQVPRGRPVEKALTDHRKSNRYEIFPPSSAEPFEGRFRRSSDAPATRTEPSGALSCAGGRKRGTATFKLHNDQGETWPVRLRPDTTADCEHEDQSKPKRL